MSRLDSRAFRWFVLCVPPQRELFAKGVLKDEGFAVFVPVAREPKFANGAARARMIKTEVSVPIMPRYVFLGMNKHTPGWFGALRFTMITGVIWHGGKPYQVPHDSRVGTTPRPGIRELMWRHNRGEFDSPDHHKYMQTHNEFEEGADVITDLGFEGRVEKITEDKAKVLIEILGSFHEIDIDLAKLTPR